MKITGFYDNGGDDGKGFLVWPDSVWLRNGKPMFLPDEEEKYYVCIAPAVKIDKVGKSVAERYADRYFSEVALTAVMLTERSYKLLEEREDPRAADICFDCCILTGNFIEKSFWEGMKNINISFFPLFINEGSMSHEEKLSFSGEKFFREANAAVSLASRRNTLKTGDIIIPQLLYSAYEAEIDTKVEAKAEDVELLRFKIK